MLISFINRSYRLWLYKKYLGKTHLDQEIKYVKSLIEIDPRNNSAWNQLFSIISFSDKSRFADVVDYCLSAAVKIPSNQSPWNFLTGYDKQHNIYIADTIILEF